MKPYLFILIITNLIASCVMDYADSRLQVKNNSSHDISVEILSDTIIHEILNRPEYYVSRKILPEEIQRESIPGKKGWSFMIKESTNKKLNVFIFSTDTIKKYGDFEYIITHKLYKRYEFEEQELDKVGWIIEYP